MINVNCLCNCLPWYNWKIAELALINNHSLTLCNWQQQRKKRRKNKKKRKILSWIHSENHTIVPNVTKTLILQTLRFWSIKKCVLDVDIIDLQYGCFESFPFRQKLFIFVCQTTWFWWNVRHWTSGVYVHNENSNRLSTG